MNLPSKLDLEIPSISIRSAGISSSKMTRLSVVYQRSVDENNPLNLFDTSDNQSNILYVGPELFRKLIRISYHISWSDFVTKYDHGQSFGIQALKGVCVYVDRVSDVEKVASLLQQLGYNENYTFKSFHNITASIHDAVVFAIALPIVFLLATIGHVLLSFNAYLKVQQKDMGILRHFGYDESDVFRIYAYSISRIFVMVGVGVSIYTLILGALCIPISHLYYTFELVAFLCILTLVTYRVIISWLLRGYVGKGVLDLLKFSKEFE